MVSMRYDLLGSSNEMFRVERICQFLGNIACSRNDNNIISFTRYQTFFELLRKLKSTVLQERCE